MILRSTKNLPESRKNTIFVVSRVVAEFADHRDDLYIPYGLVKDSRNTIVGCQCLMRIQRDDDKRQAKTTTWKGGA